MKRRMNKFFSILLVICMILSMVPAAVFAVTPGVIYLKPNSEWLTDGARFAAYFFGNGDTWVSMTDSDGDGYYEAAVPSGFTSVIFCRMNGGTTANNWDNKWNQSADLTIPTDGKNCWTLSSGSWDGSGAWSKYTVQTEETEVDYYLFGFINGANYACEEDYENMGSYKFVDGKLSATFESDSYVAVKTTGNGKWYMSKAYAASSPATLVVGGSEKLFVPGGVKVNFTLAVNGDTLTLSYTTDSSSCAHSSHNAQGVCTACGATVGHAWKDGKCSVCGSECPHSWSNTGTCLTCGSTCTHTSHDTNGTCSTCGNTVSHSFVSGKCSVCGKTVDYYLFGYINGANYGCEEDAANLGSYKFTNGKLTVTFDCDSYVAVKTGDNASWYMTDGWAGEVTSVTLYNTNSLTTVDKLYVPGGAQVTFTLTVNSNDTLTLKYSVSASSCSHLNHNTSGICTACGSTVGHSYDNGTCACGATCPHSSHNTSGVCTTCGVTVGHTYVNYKCTVCGATTEAPVNYKTLVKEIKKDTNRWRDILCSPIGRINIVKMSILPKQSIDSMQSLSSYQRYFSEPEQIISQFVWKYKKP